MKKLLFCLLLLAIVLTGQIEARVIPNIPNMTGPTGIHLAPIQVQSHHVSVTIKDSVAVTTLESVFYNPNHRVLEGTYLLALPKGSSIAKFSLWIDGKEMPAELLDSTKARNLYISIVRRMIDPALLEFVGRETFKMRIFPLPARGTRKIKMSYQQVLPVDGNLMRYEYPLTAVGNNHEDSIGDFSFNVKIASQIPIKSVFSPTHQLKVNKSEKEASVDFQGRNVTTDKDLVLYVSVSNKKVDLTFIPFCKSTDKGHFLMMLAPKAKLDRNEINPKDVVFVLDTSGSMVGDNMDQAKNALKYCLHQLRPRDNFNIIPFSTEASPYKDKLLGASQENIKAALEYVDEEIYARGGTNIEEALGYALDMASKSGNRPYMVIFITDGKPTIGVTNPEEIITKVKKAGLSNLRLFTLGIGDQLNTKMLDRLAEENNGIREYVGSKEDIEVKISGFFDKVSSPVLSNIKIRFPSAEGLRVTEIYPREFPDLFKGSRLTVLGRYKGHGDQAIRVTGMLAGKNKEFVFEVRFPERHLENEHVPRLWAVRKVGFLLDQIRLHGENSELKKEVVLLARKYGIVTPYTSYLVVEDTPMLRIPPRPGVVRPSMEGRMRKMKSDERKMEQETGFHDVSGKKAVEASKLLRDMKESDNLAADDKPQKGDGRVGKNVVRKIAYKTFYKQGDIWYDSEALAKERDHKRTRISYLGDDYIALMQKHPDIAKFLAIGRKVVLLWQDVIYEIF